MTLRAIPLLPEPACLSPDTSLLDTLHLMLDRGVNHLPVCNDGNWAGLVDINDILGELLPVSARGEHGLSDLRFVGDGIALIAKHIKELSNKTVREVELHDLPTLDEDTPLLEAALLLHRHVIAAAGAGRRRQIQGHAVAPHPAGAPDQQGGELT